MPERVAKVVQTYADREIKVGETFRVEQEHIKLLLTIGRIEPEEGEPGYVAKDLKADEPKVYETRDMSARAKRPYNRKSTAQ